MRQISKSTMAADRSKKSTARIEEMVEAKNKKNVSDKNSVPVEAPTTPIFPISDEVSTVEDVINRAGIGWFQVKLTLLSGFVWMSKGFDAVYAMFIGPLTTCDWKLVRWHSAFTATITTVSTLLGCIAYGISSDKFGRRAALSASLIFVFVFGAVSVGLPSYTWFLVFETVSSFSVGGFPQALTLCCELMPGKHRGRSVFILSCFWAAGVTLLLSFLSSATHPIQSHWRLFAAVATLPSFVSMVMMRFFPESVRFLLVSDEHATAALAGEMACKNNKEAAPPRIFAPPARGRLGDLFCPSLCRTTLLFWIMGLATAVTYNSLDEMSPFIIGDQIDDIEVLNSTEVNFLGELQKPIHCLHNVTSNQFVKIIWKHVLDFPGFVIYMILIDAIDRKILMCASYAISAVFVFLLFLETDNVTALTSFFYCARTLLLGQADMLLLMVAEAFPTVIRGTAVGMEAAFLYLGYFITPYVAQSLLQLDPRYLIGFCGGACVLSCIACALLPRETRGKEMTETLPS